MPLADRKLPRDPFVPRDPFARPLVLLLLVGVTIAAGLVLFEHIERGLTMLVPPSQAASARPAAPAAQPDASAPDVNTSKARGSAYFPSQFANQAKDVEPQPPTF